MYADQSVKCTHCNEWKSESDFYNYKHEHHCKLCHSKIRKADYAANRIARIEKAKEWRINNVDKCKSTKLKQAFGMTIKEYNQMLAKQHHVCIICKRPEKAVMRGKVLALAVDHRHSDGKIRGLLCMKCNRALGLLEENENSIQTMLDYLRTG